MSSIPIKRYTIWQRIAARWLRLGILFLNAQSVQGGEGICFRYFFEKGEVRCTTEYRVTGTFPIEIKRIYADGRVECIVLKPVDAGYAQEVYELVSKSEEHLKTYMPSVVEDFGRSEHQARLSLERLSLFANVNLRVLIFFKGVKDEVPRIVGEVATQLYDAYREGSVDGMYWVGDPTYTGVKGVAGIAIQALFNHFIAIGKAKWVNLVMRKENRGSENIAIRLGMKKIDPKAYQRWGYSEKQDGKYTCAYSLSAQAWRAKHWSDISG